VPSDETFAPELLDTNGAEVVPLGHPSSTSEEVKDHPEQSLEDPFGLDQVTIDNVPMFRGSDAVVKPVDEHYVTPFTNGITTDESDLFLTALGLDGEAKIQGACMIQNLSTNLQKFILSDFRPDNDSESILDQLTDYVTDLTERPSTKEIKWWFHEMKINDDNCLRTFKTDYAAATQRQVMDTFRPRCPPINAPGLFMSFLHSRGGKGVAGSSKGKGKAAEVFKRVGDNSSYYNTAKRLRT